jgi:pimeloyl-ACP methyl ester carboxylesterase
MSSASSHFFQLQGGVVHYLKSGNGKKLLIAFHGYGNDASMFVPISSFLEKDFTIVAVNFPYHGETEWKSTSPFSIDDVHKLLQHLMRGQSVERISLLGYSMGGRVCLSIVENMPKLVEQCILVASDGLVFNSFYFFATHSSLGMFLLKRFVIYPNNYIQFFKWLRKRKWMDAARYKFVMNFVDSRTERELLLKVWPVMSMFIPNRKIIQNALAKYNIELIVFSGAYDRIIPLRHAQQFKRTVTSCELMTLEKGHRIFDSETWKIIANCLC